MLQLMRRAPVRFKGARLPGLGALVHALGQIKPALIAVIAAALAMSVVAFTGALNSFERRLSDAWFSLAKVAPSGRTILVTLDRPTGTACA